MIIISKFPNIRVLAVFFGGVGVGWWWLWGAGIVWLEVKQKSRATPIRAFVACSRVNFTFFTNFLTDRCRCI
jgi:hypothetical protein